jgi:hypothetical protein
MDHTDEKGTTHFDDIHQHEATSTESSDHGADIAHGFAADQSTVRKGYFYSVNFLMTMLATGLGLASATGGFGLAAANLTLINNDIGPDPNIAW